MILESGKEIVYAFLLDGKGGATKLDGEKVEHWKSSDGVLWLHLDGNQENVETWIHLKSGAPAFICNAFLDDGNRPRLVIFSDMMFVSMRAINFNTTDDPDDMVFLHLLLTKDRIITLRHRRVKATSQLHHQCENGEAPIDVSDFFYQVLAFATDRIGEVVDDVFNKVDEAEEDLVENNNTNLRGKVADVRRQTINLRRFLWPQRDLLFQIAEVNIEWFNNGKATRFKEIAEKYNRYIDDIRTARERATITQEELNSITNERLSKTMYILAIVSTIFLPLTFLTGLLGINVTGIPYANHPYAFGFVSLFAVIIVITEILYFKWKKLM